MSGFGIQVLQKVINTEVTKYRNGYNSDLCSRLTPLFSSRGTEYIMVTEELRGSMALGFWRLMKW